MCHRPDVISIDAELSCPAGTNYRSDINKCEQVETINGEFSCASHGEGFILINNCPVGSTFDDVAGKCLGLGINESPTRQCVDSESSQIAPLLSCPVTDTIAPDTSGNCPSEYIYNTVLDVCETSRYTLADDICTLLIEKPYEKSCPEGELYDEATDQCVLTSIANYPATVSCPDGYVMEGTNCFKRATVNATPTCDVDNGFIKVGDHCEKTDVSLSPVSAFCSEGFSLSDDRLSCVKAVLTTPLPPICPEDFIETGSVCSKTTIEQIGASEICSHGFTYNISIDLCERISAYEPVLTCNDVDGYKFNEITGQCEKTISERIDATQTCTLPSVIGTGEFANYCHKVVVSEASYSCKIGFTFNEELSICEMDSTTVTVAQVMCSDGYQPSGGECIKVTQEEPIKTCPEESEYDPVQKVCKVLTEFVTDLLPYCEKPKVLENGQCVEKFFTYVTGVCPDPTFTYNADTKTCAKVVTEEVPPIELCGSGDGDQESGNCTSGYSVSALADCGEGYYYDALADICIQEQGDIVAGTPQCLDVGFAYDAESELCVKETNANGEDCPTGYEWNEVLSICLKQETRAPNIACPANYAFDGENCTKAVHTTVTCPVDYIYDALSKSCTKDESVAAAFECKAGYTFDGNECISDTTQPPLCSETLVYNSESKLCETTGSVDVTKTCPSGFHDNNGNCAKVTKASAGCNNGFSYDAGSNKCVRFISEAPQEYCFKGADTGTNCEIKESVMPQCTEQYYFNSDKQVCEKLTFEPGSIYCPELLGYQSILTPENRCAYFEEKLLNTNGLCPNGFELNNDVCIKFIEYKPPFYSCSDGYVQQSFDTRQPEESAQCTLIETLAPECDFGFDYSDGYCHKSHFNDYDLTCNEGLVLEDGSCVASDTQAILCPLGDIYSSLEDKCLSLAEVSYNLSCPENYSLSGDMCVSSYTEEPTCNGGFSFNMGAGVCEANTQPPQCIDGYTYDNSLDKCKKEEQLNADGYCDADKFDTGSGCVIYSAAICSSDGYSLNTTTDRCEKFETKPEEGLCGADEVDTGSGCIKVESASCPSNHALNTVNDRCEYLEEVEANYTCSEDEVDTGAGCKKVAPPECPQDYSFVPSNDRCEKFESKSASALCAEDWTDVGSGCQKFTAPICTDSNYSSSLKQCVENQSYDMTYHCGVGDVDTGSGCKATKQPICSAGFTYYGDRDQCEQSQSTPAQESCPANSYDNGTGCVPFEAATCEPGATFDFSIGKCKSTESKPATGVCMTGTDTGSACQITETKAPSCDSGFTYNNASNKCEKTLTTPANGVCASGTDTGSGCSVLEQKAPPCNGDYIYNTSTNRCEKTLTTPANGVCASGTDTGSGCSEIEQKVPPCNSGYIYNTGTDRCEKTLTTPANGICASGTDTGSGCSVLEQKVPPCPAGYTYNSSTNKCEKPENTAATQYCPSGQQDVGSGCRKTWTPSIVDCKNMWDYDSELKTCVPMDDACYEGRPNCTSNATPHCNSGVGGYFDSAGICISDNVYPYSVKCDSGWTLSGSTCSRTASVTPNCGTGWTLNTSTDKCERNVVHDYDEYQCDSGWTLSGTTCSKLVFEAVDCGEGWSLNTASDKCERYVDSNFESYECDSGWTLSGTTCSKLVFEAVDCGEGWSLNTASDKCERYVDSTYDEYTCDSGWVLSGSTCSKLVQEEPDCGTGWTHNTTDDICERVTESPYDYYECESGWTLTGTTCSRIVHDEPICRDGYSYHSSNKRCEAAQESYDYSCLDGWTLNGTSCEGVAVEPASCADGYILDVDVDRCVSNNQEQYLNNCAVGYTPNHSTMMCEKFNYTTPVCSPGILNESTDTCESEIKDYYYECDSGWDVNNTNCERTLTSVVQCPVNYSYINTSKQCETTETAYERTCEPGYTLNGVKCEKMHTAAPICSENYHYDNVNDQCQTAQTPHGYICGDISWTHNGSSCERMLSELPYCDDGQNYSNSNDQCQGAEIDYHYGCPEASPEWTVVGNKCERTLVDEAICSADEELVDDKCTFVESNQKYFHCIDSSYSLSVDQCEKIAKLPVNCEGADFSSSTDDCVSPHTELMDTQCGDGWTLSEDACKKSSVLSKVLECEEGFTHVPEDGSCVQVIYERPSFTCPETHPVMAEGMSCEMVTTLDLPIINYYCANDSHTLDQNKCLVEGGATICENPAHDLVNIAEVGAPEELVCRYQETVTQEPVYNCPETYTLEKAGLCVKQEVTQALMRCPNNYLLDEDDGLCKTTQNIKVPFELSCTPTFEIVGTFCIKVEVSSPVFSCPDAEDVLVGALCYSADTITEPPTKICKNETAEGKCEQDVYTEPSYSCPEDYMLTPFGNSCVRDTVEIGVDPTVVCVEGYTYDLGLCSRIDTQVAVIACPDSSWVLNGSVCDRTLVETTSAIGCGDDAILFENRCYLKEVTDVTFGCGDGFTYDSINNLCEREVTRVEPIIFTCTEGYKVVGDLCIDEDVVLVTIECLDVDHRLIGTICYEESEEMGEPTNSCQLGFTDTGSNCSKTNTFPATLSCNDSSYFYNPANNMCIKTVEEIKTPSMICDGDYVQISPILCQKTVLSVDPIISCPDGWSQGSGRCIQSADIIVEQGFCESGFEKIDGECAKFFSELATIACEAPATKKLSKCFVTTQETEPSVEVCDN